MRELRMANGRVVDDTPRCPTCGSPIRSAETPDAEGRTRLEPCQHMVTVG